MKYICILLIFLLGCHYTPAEQRSFALFLSAQAADGWSTERNIHAGFTEVNPILDDRPSDDEIWLFKGGVVLTGYILGELFPEHREHIFNIGSFVGFGCTAANVYVYEERK